MPTYGEKLQQLREEQGMTQVELAGKVSCLLGKLRSHEQSVNSISSEDLFAYCKALGVTCAKFDGCLPNRKENRAAKPKGRRAKK